MTWRNRSQPDQSAREENRLKVYRCWWCGDFLPSKGRDCRQKECIRGRRSGVWKKRKKEE